LLVIRRNNFLSPADMRSSMVNDWLQTPLLRALQNKLSRRLALCPWLCFAEVFEGVFFLQLLTSTANVNIDNAACSSRCFYTLLNSALFDIFEVIECSILALCMYSCSPSCFSLDINTSKRRNDAFLAFY